MNKLFFIATVGLACITSACGDDIDPIERDWITEEEEVEEIQHNIEIKDESVAFVHPGILHSQEDIDRAKNNVASQTAPWIDGWNALMTNNHFTAPYNEAFKVFL